MAACGAAGSLGSGIDPFGDVGGGRTHPLRSAREAARAASDLFQDDKAFFFIIVVVMPVLVMLGACCRWGLLRSGRGSLFFFRLGGFQLFTAGLELKAARFQLQAARL